MENIKKYNREDFIKCEWKLGSPSGEFNGYFSVTQSLQNLCELKKEAKLENQKDILFLLAGASSMILKPSSINDPFKPFAELRNVDSYERSPILDDFSKDDLNFFEEILDDIEDHWLKSRLADMLWVSRKPKKIIHAEIAIASYTAHSIDQDSWYRGVGPCWERAARLAIQTKNTKSLEVIRNNLFSEFKSADVICWSLIFSVADLMDRLTIDCDFRKEIAERTLQIGVVLKEGKNFHPARKLFELSAKKFEQLSDKKKNAENLILIAECFEEEANLRKNDSNFVANTFYEKAIQTYRRISTGERDCYGVVKKIELLRGKLSITGLAALGEMRTIKIPGIDTSELTAMSIASIKGKSNLEEALWSFVKLSPAPSFQQLREEAKKSIQTNSLSSLFASSCISSDGRVISKTPSANMTASEDHPSNALILNKKIHQIFCIDVDMQSRVEIIPALNQILSEHRVTQEFLEEMCYHSPIISHDRIKLLSFALWLGFEHDFGNAIHLICPQVEHVVRVQLKAAGALTSNIDKYGIESENGLSTLMDLPEATKVFGEDLVFEIKSIFTEALGHNLRNQVAHGLLNDNSSSSMATVYAWWMMLRIIMESIFGSGFQVSEPDNQKEK